MISPHRSRKHLSFVRGQRCAFCARPATEAHHVGRLAGGGGMGIKPCDLLAAPLCREHHRELHTRGTIGSQTEAATMADLWRSVSLCLRARLLEGEGA